MEALVIGLIIWITQHSHFDYDLHHGIPAIQQAEQIELAALITDDETVLEKDEHTASFQDFVNQLVAVYDHRQKTILVSSKIDIESPYAHSIIVHELVHFIQYQQGINRKVDCLNALERDAYEIQGRYMDTHHIAKPFDKVTVALRSTCWGTHQVKEGSE